MKIVSANRGQVQSTGRINYNPSAGLSAENRKIDAITNIAAEGIETYKKIEKKKTERHVQQSDLFTQKAENEINQKWGGRDFFTVDEIPEELRTEGMDTKGRIPSAEIFPDIYKMEMEKAVSNGSKIIENTNIQSLWKEEATSKLSGKYSKLIVNANKIINRQIYVDQKDNFDNMMASDNPIDAKKILGNMVQTQEVKGMMQDANERIETKDYDLAMLTNDLKKMKEYKEKLETETYDGKLGLMKRRVWSSKLNTKIQRQKALTTSSDKVEKERIERKIKIITQNSSSGKYTEPSEVADLITEAVASGVKQGKIKDLILAAEQADIVNVLALVPILSKEEVLESLLYRKDLEQFEKDKIEIALESAIDAQKVALRKNPIGAAVDSKFIEELIPINGETTNERIGQFLGRQNQVDMIEAHYGVETKGIFENDEAKLVANFINSSPIQNKIQYASEIVSALGEDAAKTFEQLNVEAGMKSFFIAGTTAIYGSREQSNAILQGAEYVKESDNDKDLSLAKAKYEIQTRNNIGRAFYNRPGYESAIMEAGFNASVYYAISSGNRISLMDSDQMEAGLTAATGGVISQSGNKIQSPVFNMEQSEWDDWIKRLPEEYITELGGIDGISNSEFLTRIQDDEFRFEGTAQGEYALINKKTGFPVKKSGSQEMFILKYSPDVKLKPRKVGRRGRR